MQKEIEKIESELTERIYKIFIKKYDGNKSAFAKATKCSEATIRRILRKEQGITINLLFRIADALDTTANQLLENLKIPKEL